MPEVSQYFLTHKELVEAIIKQTNVHDGKWMLLVNFGFGAANIGTGPEGSEAFPSGVCSVQKIGIQRADDNAAANLVVDAAEINPAQKVPKPPARKSST